MADKTLHIDGPTATCGHCQFTSALSGTFSVEDGRLAWRGDADLQPRRGPDLRSCCESSPVIEFEGIEAGRVPLTAEQVAALRQSAAEAG